MKKNKKVLLVVFGLLIGVSISFAYFVGRSLTSGSGASLTVKTATLNGTKMEVEGELFFNDGFIYPGHTKVSSIKVTATGNNELIPYNLIWKGINSLYTSLNYKVYRSDKKIEVTASCEKRKEIVDGKQLLHEVCNINNLQELGEEIYTGTIGRSEENTKVILAEDEYITSTEEGKEVYYYVVIEYPNNEDIEENQNQDIGEEFSGEVTVEKSETNADINIMAVYVENEDGKYTQTSEIPQRESGLTLKTSKCNNGASVQWDSKNWAPLILNFKQSGTSCYLYFNKSNSLDDIILADNVKELTEGFIGSSCDSGCTLKQNDLYKGTDDDGPTYYFRGTVNNNYVQFGTNKDGKEMYWRIIRINGDGTIRLIYDGTTIHENGEITTDSIAMMNQQWYKLASSEKRDNKYFGFSWEDGKVRPGNYKTAIKSNAMQQLEQWYIENLEKDYGKYISTSATFCNDRTHYVDKKGEIPGTEVGDGSGIGTNTTYYGAYTRTLGQGSTLGTSVQKPSFKCYVSDKYSVDIGNLDKPVGLITADEVVFAGGYAGRYNHKYWLYNGQAYWTMSPCLFAGGSSGYMVVIDASGLITTSNVDVSRGIRPVINLKADTKFKAGGFGTIYYPYIVDIN